MKPRPLRGPVQLGLRMPHLCRRRKHPGFEDFKRFVRLLEHSIVYFSRVLPKGEAHGGFTTFTHHGDVTGPVLCGSKLNGLGIFIDRHCKSTRLRLTLSLHGATDEVRGQIMPVNRRNPLKVLLEACDYYVAKKRRMTFEYILIAGVKDTDE